MVGQGVLRECLRDPEVETVLAIGRNDLQASMYANVGYTRIGSHAASIVPLSRATLPQSE